MREFRDWAADLALQPGAGHLEGEVVSTVCETEGLAVRRTSVLGLELTVDESMRWSEIVAVAELGDDRHLEFGTVAEVMVVARVSEALAAELLLTSLCERLKPKHQSAEFTGAQTVGP